MKTGKKVKVETEKVNELLKHIPTDNTELLQVQNYSDIK